MASLIEKMLAVKGAKGVHAEIMADTPFFNVETILTDLPVLNVAFSGSLDKGLLPGITILSGESGTFKTMLGLYSIKSYLKKYSDAVCLFYDTEYGTTPEYMRAFGIDMGRVIHIPILHVEELKFDMTKRLESIDRGDRVIIFVDSLGALASKKEIEDAENEKRVADMSRAKSIKSWLRIVTPHFTAKELPCIIINHVYKEICLYPKDVIPGGLAVVYLANQVFIITRSKLDDALEGNKFTIKIYKSRYVKRESKLPFEVTYEKGIMKYSGLLDIAREGGFIEMYGKGRYRLVGEESGPTKKEMGADFWEPILASTEFKQYIEKRFKLSPADMETPDDFNDDIIEPDSE